MKTSTIVLLVFLGCAGLFVAMVVLCAGIGFYAYRQADVNVSPMVNALFAKMDRRKDSHRCYPFPPAKTPCIAARWQQKQKGER